MINPATLHLLLSNEDPPGHVGSGGIQGISACAGLLGSSSLSGQMYVSFQGCFDRVVSPSKLFFHSFCGIEEIIQTNMGFLYNLRVVVWGEPAPTALERKVRLLHCSHIPPMF
jgi:hypothetical protein